MNLRTMTTADIPAGMRLKDVAGWNQTPADWRCFLQSSPRGCFAAEVDGKVVGTAATIVYEQRFAWIGMVLVDPGFRGRGIGTRLLRKAVEHLDEIGIGTMKLDATPAGRPIYRKLGFEDEYEIERWLLKRPASEAAPASALHSVCDRVLEHFLFGKVTELVSHCAHLCRYLRLEPLLLDRLLPLAELVQFLAEVRRDC